MKRPVPCRGEISRALIDAATHEGIVVHDGGRILAANRAFAALLGLGERDVPVGAEIAGLVPPPLLAAGSVPSVVELDRLTASGAPGGSGGPAAAVEIVARQLAYEGRAATVLAVRDVSERRLTQAALREGEERLRLAVEATGLGTWDVEPGSGACRWSAECRAILGLSPEAAADLGTLASLIHPDDRARVLELYRRAYEPAGSGRYEAEFRLLRASDQVERWVQATGRVYFEAAGRPTRAVGTLADVTERRRAHEELRESEGRYRALVETSPDAVYAHREGIIILANARAVELLGAKSPEELVGRSIFELVDPASLPLVRARTAALAEPGAQVALAELTYRRLDGTPFPVEAAAAAVLVQSRLVVQVVFRDLTARKTAEAELRHAHERLARHMDDTPLAVVELACRPGDDAAWRVKAWSGQAEAMFGWAAAEATGRTLQELALVHEAERDKAVLLRRDLLGQRPRTATTLRCRTRTGEVRHCRIHASVVPGDAGRPEAALLLVEDITDLVAAQESVHRLAQHDELTGLPNRLLFQDRLGQALARAGREGELVGVMLLDLDHFKEVNDTLGHSAGDALLGEVAARLRACARESDTWARLGGDEFALVQAGLREPGGAAVMARRVLEALAAPFRVEEQELEVGASLGVTVFPGDGDTPERLVRNADVALYRAKAAGRGRFRFYRPEMDRELQDNRSLQRGLREALDTRGLRLVYQPVVGLPDRHVGKVEALLRWPHPGGGFVPPSTFIPIAEASGLIRPLGQWVLREACRQAAAWRAEGLRLKVAVNVSAAQLRDPGLPEAVRAALRDADLEAGLLELELTESVFLDPSKEQIVQTLRKVAGLGVTLAIDDFGTGYSSLAYLKHFPFHEVKVDGSFVADIGREPGGEAIVAAVVALAHNLGKRATAEGVESPEQLAFLGERGCDAAQGFLLGRPQGPSEIGNLLLAAT